MPQTHQGICLLPHTPQPASGRARSCQHGRAHQVLDAQEVGNWPPMAAWALPNSPTGHARRYPMLPCVQQGPPPLHRLIGSKHGLQTARDRGHHPAELPTRTCQHVHPPLLEVAHTTRSSRDTALPRFTAPQSTQPSVSRRHPPGEGFQNRCPASWHLNRSTGFRRKQDLIACTPPKNAHGSLPCPTAQTLFS